VSDGHEPRPSPHTIRLNAVDIDAVELAAQLVTQLQDADEVSVEIGGMRLIVRRDG